jgi:hypothetical protein
MPKKHGKGTGQPRDQQNSEKAQFDTLMIKCLDLADKIGNDTRLKKWYQFKDMYGNMNGILGLGFDEDGKQSHPYDVCTDILVLMTSIHETLDRVGDKAVQTIWKAKVRDLESELTSFMGIIGKPDHLSYSSPGITDLVVHHVMEALKVR